MSRKCEGERTREKDVREGGGAGEIKLRPPGQRAHRRCDSRMPADSRLRASILHRALTRAVTHDAEYEDIGFAERQLMHGPPRKLFSVHVQSVCHLIARIYKRTRDDLRPRDPTIEIPGLLPGHGGCNCKTLQTS